MDDPNGADYTKLQSDVGPVAYPGGAVYVYTLVNLISGRNVTWAFGQYMHIVIDFFRMWLLVKVYKIVYRGRPNKNLYIYALMLMQAKYKFCSVVFNFNDTIMHLVALVSIYCHLKGRFLLAIFFIGFASSIKMSAFLYIPGAMLVSAFEHGLLSAAFYLIGAFAV